jgi:hypothetical protein
VRILLPLLTLLALLTACASRSGTAASPSSSTPAPDPAGASDSDLLVDVDRGDGLEPERYILTCGRAAEGDHPDPVAACAHLEGMTAPFAPLRGDMACTEQYGGPETARITGRWHGEPVELALSRTDGCRISQWAGLGPLLPPIVVEPVD